jgi:hypothetical protein
MPLLPSALNRPGRVATLSLAIAGLGVAGLIGWGVAAAMEARVERRLEARLAAAGLDWLDARVNGTRVTLRGEAADEASALAAHEVARAAGAWVRVRDAMTVAPGEPLKDARLAAADAEALTMTILLDEHGVSLMGRASAAAHGALLDALARDLPTRPIVDLTAIEEGKPPPAWETIAPAAARIASSMGEALVDIRAGRVVAHGAPDNIVAARQLDGAVRELREAGVVVQLSATETEAGTALPAMFTIGLAEGRADIDACTAPDTGAATRILAVARELLDAPPAPCPVDGEDVAKGWVEATTAGMTALAMLDAGRFELVGTEARLIPPAEADPARFEAALAALATSLPQGYAMPLALPENEQTARAEAPTRAA